MIIKNWRNKPLRSTASSCAHDPFAEALLQFGSLSALLAVRILLPNAVVVPDTMSSDGILE